MPLLVVVAACDDPSPAEMAAAFVERVPVLECEHLTRCGVFETVEHCLTARRQLPDDFGVPQRLPYDHYWVEAVERGTVRFSAENSHGCLAALAERTCSLWAADDVTYACRDVFRGVVPNGERSAWPFECTSGWWTLDSTDCSPGEPCCEQTCAPLPSPVPSGPDEPCSDVGPSCGRGLRCSNGRCVEGLQLGQECGDYRECRRGLVCNGRCVTPDSLPSTCSPDRDQCHLLGSRCTLDHGCQPLAFRGESCEIAVYLCAPGLGCDPETKRCVGFAAEGEPCATAVPADICGSGLVCVEENDRGVCRPITPDGAPCESDYVCASGYCDPANDTCGRITCP